MKDAFLEWLLPRTCVGCRALGSSACRDCLLRWSQPWLELNPFPGIDWLFSLGSYKPLFAQFLIERWKFDGDRTVGVILGQQTAKYWGLILGQIQESDFLLVPVPLHPLKERMRGYNQAEDFAVAVGSETGLGIESMMLKRRRMTKPQKECHDDQKYLNVRNAFILQTTINPPPDTTIVLVDDLATTGSTLVEAAQCLHAAGWIQIGGIVAARG